LVITTHTVTAAQAKVWKKPSFTSYCKSIFQRRKLLGSQTHKKTSLNTHQNRSKQNMNETIFMACKQLIDDAKMGCADLVFKEICLEILAKARNILTEDQFRELSDYAAERMREKSLTEAQLPM